MKILFIAPQPFYEERGTLIAIDMLLNAFSKRGDEVDLLTFHVGDDRPMPGLKTCRISPWLAPKSIKPGFSAAKVYCDIFLTARAFSLARQNDYDLVWAVEEGAFIARLLKTFFGLPFVFDMDSSMADQLVERFGWLGFMHGLLRALENIPVRSSTAVVPMCEAIAETARPITRGGVHVLKDVSLVQADETPDPEEDIRKNLGIEGVVIMYIGNLEPYQGIDLLLESFVDVAPRHPDAAIVIIGGAEKDILFYRQKAADLGIGDQVHLLGPRPVGYLGYYMSQADIMASPRTQGINTPMKVYSYLDSGAAVLATRLPTHTQVMDDDVSKLTEPDAQSYGSGMDDLIRDSGQREALASAARELVAREHSVEAFQRQVSAIMADIDARLPSQ